MGCAAAASELHHMTPCLVQQPLVPHLTWQAGMHARWLGSYGACKARPTCRGHCSHSPSAHPGVHLHMQGHPLNAERVARGKPAANLVLLRGCGIRIAVQPFRQRWGLRACMVAPTRIIAGLGMSLGIDLLDVPAATGEPCRC